MKTNQKASYSLIGLKDPTDRQLTSLMKTVATKAGENAAKAHQIYFKSLEEQVEATFQEWIPRLKALREKNIIPSPRKKATNNE